MTLIVLMFMLCALIAITFTVIYEKIYIALNVQDYREHPQEVDLKA